MSECVISAEIRLFLLRHIDSITQLEGLLWLRTQAGQSQDAATIAGHLYLAGEEAVVLLDQLARGGLLAVDGAAGTRRYAYRPMTAELAATVAQIDALYRLHLIPLTNLIHTRSRRDLGKSGPVPKE